MGEISTLNEAHNWNLTRIADAFGLHRDTVRKRLRDAGVLPTGTRSNASVYALKDVGPALFADQFTSNATEPDELPPQERRAWYQSENERIKLERELRNLIDADDVLREYSQLAKAVATTLDSLPDILERDAGIGGDQLEVIQRVVDELREQIYQRVMSDDGGE